MVFRTQQKDHLIFTANRLMIAGLGFLALAMTGAVLLITDVLFGSTATIITATATLAALRALLGTRYRCDGGSRARTRGTAGRTANCGWLRTLIRHSAANPPRPRH